MKTRFWNVYSKMILLGLGSIFLKLLFVFFIFRQIIFNGHISWGMTVYLGVLIYIGMTILTLGLIYRFKENPKLYFAICTSYVFCLIVIPIFYFLPDISSAYFPQGSFIFFFLHIALYLCTCYTGHRIVVNSLSEQKHLK